LKPWEFGQLQPHEFNTMVEGYQWRQEQQENVLAFFVCNIMSCMVKKPPSVKELLKPLRRHQQKRDRAADEAALRETFKDRLGGG
jgi:hypothetical protein